MSEQQLTKAKITIEDGADKDKFIVVLFNPTEYTLDRSNAFKATPIPGLSTPLVQFINGDTDVLSMSLFLDDYTDDEGPVSRLQPEEDPVAKRLVFLDKLLDIDRDLHAPPPVRFSWGRLQFVAVVEKLGRKVTLFHPDGTPARATISITFKEYRTLQQQLQQPRRESADKSKRRQIVGRDSLWALAGREYDEPRGWRRIASANDLDDPRAIAPGDWLLLPPAEEGDGSRRAV